MVASHGEDKIVLQADRTFRGFEVDRVGLDLLHSAAEVGGNFAILDAVLNVGQNPILHVAMEFRPAMYQDHARAVPPQVKSRDGGGVLASNHQNVGIEKRMGLAIVMKDFGKIFAGNVQRVG